MLEGCLLKLYKSSLKCKAKEPATKELQRNYVLGHQLLYPKFVRVVEALLVEYIVTMPKEN